MYLKILFKQDDICDATDGQKDTIENPALGTPNYADNLMAHPEGDRLDIMMDIFFRYIYSVCYENGKYVVLKGWLTIIGDLSPFQQLELYSSRELANIFGY